MTCNPSIYDDGLNIEISCNGINYSTCSPNIREVGVGQGSVTVWREEAGRGAFFPTRIFHHLNLPLNKRGRKRPMRMLVVSGSYQNYQNEVAGNQLSEVGVGREVVGG